MLTIGEFARLGSVTVKALHHYDALGLLKPAAIDPASGYRRYTEAQLPRLHRIGELKTLGLRLEVIGSMLDDDLPPAEWRALLHTRQGELLREIRERQATLARVDQAVRHVDAATAQQTYAVELVDLEPVLVAGVRDRIATGTIYRLFEELRGWLAAQGAEVAGPFVTLGYHNGSYQADTHDAEAAVVLDAPLPAGGRIQVRELPAVQAARVVHHGDYRQMYRAHEVLGRWIEANGYQRLEPEREIYWRDQAHVATADSFLTEIVVPVQRRAQADRFDDVPRLGRSFELGELTLDIQVLANGVCPANLWPACLPEGLVVTQIAPRLYGAADRHGQIVLSWLWNPSSVSFIGLLWHAEAGEPPEPEPYPDGERMRYYLPGANGQAATLLLVERGAYLLLLSATLAREELLQIAASFPSIVGDAV